ncbi:hypothetical protein [Flavobacterium fontis]|nr:hypothetical protein [Flavobacterium fontis]
MIYIPGGTPTDVEYEPCMCKMSIWDTLNGPFLDTIITFDKRKINIFIKSLKKVKINESYTFPNFTNAFIYKKGRVIDTIYANSHFTIFAKKKELVEENIIIILKGFEITVDRKEFIPKEFLEEYQLKTRTIF